LQQRVEHPCGLLVGADALGGEIGAADVALLLRRLDDVLRRAHGAAIVGKELADHLVGGRRRDLLGDCGELLELAVARRCLGAQRANALGDLVIRRRQFGVLLLEQLVQVVEARANDVPVEALRLQIERVGIREELAQAQRDLLSGGLGPVDNQGIPLRLDL
jgi:hypothetical protein